MQLRFGRIADIDPSNGLARVEFEDDGIVSAWLQVVMPKTEQDKFSFTPDINEFVSCIMDDFLEDGVIIGSVYTTQNSPSVSGEGISAVVFGDGTEVSYDRNTSVLKINAVGEITIECTNATIKASNKITLDTQTVEATGNLNVTGNVNANGEVTAKANTLPIGLSTHKHTSPVGPTGTPIP